LLKGNAVSQDTPSDSHSKDDELDAPARTRALDPPDTELATPPSERRLGAPLRPRQARRRWVWIGGAVLALILLIVLVRACSTSNAPAARGPQGAAIAVAQSRAGDMPVYVEALGTVTPIYTVTVYSQITGRVMAVHYREGQMVKKGDPLVDVDPRPYEAQLTTAEGTLLHDQGLLAQARMDLKRYQDAWARNAIAKQTVDDQTALVGQLEGTVKSDQGTVDYDRVQLEYCHIIAPLTGRVGLRLVDPGNTVFAGSGSTLVVITQLQPITVVFNVSEDDLQQVQDQLSGGKVMSVEAFDRANEHLLESGTLTSLDNQIDTTTGTVRFRGQFPNPRLTLFPNQFVNARLLVRTLEHVTLVPTAAVQHNGTAAFVYVVRSDDTVAVTPVNALYSNETDTAVSGLAAGVSVATSGFDRLEDGAKVTVRTPQARAGASSSSVGSASSRTPSGSRASR
jgi:membrane fusion protein, multidrug efflux system